MRLTEEAEEEAQVVVVRGFEIARRAGLAMDWANAGALHKLVDAVVQRRRLERCRWRAAARTGGELTDEPSWLTDPSKIIADLEDRAKLQTLIGRLPAPMRAVVRARLAGKRYRQIAHELGITVQNCWVLYHRAVRRLRNMW
jgi:DNA-directed RNA polymerase specialized sigma24 family protein